MKDRKKYYYKKILGGIGSFTFLALMSLIFIGPMILHYFLPLKETLRYFLHHSVYLKNSCLKII